METTSIFLLALFLVLLVNGCSAADLQVNASLNTRLDPNVTSSSNNRTASSAEVDMLMEGKGEPLNKSKEGIYIKNDTDINNTIIQSGLKETQNVQKSKGDSNEESKPEEENEKEDDASDEVKPQDVSKKGGSDEDTGQLRKDGTRVEECDASNKCMDEKKQFVACLRVPGNDSPDLSLLIQNKVKGPLSVRISAPYNVHLEKTKVQLQEKGGDELKVSVRSRGTDNLIIIIAANANCSLDFRDIIAQNAGEDFDNSLKSRYFNLLSQKPAIVFISFVALLILASGFMFVRLRWRQRSSNASKYQGLDMEMPVTDTGKSESDTNNGWDNSWGDDWDDEEAPKTPSLPLTPSLSSKGLASRRLSKEGWKD